jgi:hypothetical protein
MHKVVNTPHSMRRTREDESQLRSLEGGPKWKHSSVPRSMCLRVDSFEMRPLSCTVGISCTVARAEIMIDDHTKNLDHFVGVTYLFSAPQNYFEISSKHIPFTHGARSQRCFCKEMNFRLNSMSCSFRVVSASAQQRVTPASFCMAPKSRPLICD